jgi:hypothetical protein
VPVVGMVAMALVCARFSAGEAAAAEEARRSRAGETRLVEGLCADGEGRLWDLPCLCAVQAKRVRLCLAQGSADQAQKTNANSSLSSSTAPGQLDMLTRVKIYQIKFCKLLFQSCV